MRKIQFKPLYSPQSRYQTGNKVSQGQQYARPYYEDQSIKWVYNVILLPIFRAGGIKRRVKTLYWYSLEQDT